MNAYKILFCKLQVDIAYAPFIERFQAFLLDVKNYDISVARPKLAAWIKVKIMIIFTCICFCYMYHYVVHVLNSSTLVQILLFRYVQC